MNLTKEKRSEVTGMVLRYLAPPWRGSVTEWACRNVRFDEPDNHGPFSLAGRDYIREPLDGFADDTVQDEVLVFGSQTGKTAMLMGGIAWQLANDPSRVLWVMPSIDLATAFSETRWIPLLRATDSTRLLIPTGDQRYGFKKSQQMMKGGIVSFVGSNSPGNISSHPVRVLICDEVDKFSQGARGEADAVNLAEQRTKSFALPKRIKTSTPTMVDGLVWQEFLKGDQRRFFLHCPHPECGKVVLLAWSKEFTILPIQGCEAFIRWDPGARSKGGTWDLARVEKTAHAVCPHCKGQIHDAQKTAMLRGGEWRPTAPSAATFHSRQLSSLYACSAQTTFGKLAVRFLQAKRGLLGLQGFINGDLGEPWESQDIQRERIEIVSDPTTQDAPSAKRIMAVDCQASAPHFWWVVRSWDESKGTTITSGIAAGHCDTWEDVRAVQLANSVDDVGVVIDSGFGARSDAEVYRQCARFSELVRGKQGRHIAMGWMPAKGMPTRKRWKDAKGLELPYYLRTIDPYSGTAEAGNVEISLFEFASEWFKDVLETMRDPARSIETGVTWTVPRAMATDEYWRHMDAEIKDGVRNKRTGKTTWSWRQRSARWPNHLLDCEVMQVAAAVFLGLLAIKEDSNGNAEP